MFLYFGNQKVRLILSASVLQVIGKKMKATVVILISIAMLITCTGVVMADQGVPAVPGAGGITSTAVINCDGIYMGSSALAWSISNGGDDNGLASRVDDDSSMLLRNQTQYSTTYDAGTVALSGKTNIVKTLAVSTGDKIVTQSNIKADTTVTFKATGNGGNIRGTENIMIDGASRRTASSDRITCPYGSGNSTVFPAYCNIVQAGSTYDLAIGSVVTAANDRFVGTDAKAPVVLNYNINVKPYKVQGQGTSPAMGSASAYLKAHIQEARSTRQNEDLTYAEASSAGGVINSFTHTIAYQSGKRLLP